MSHLLIVGSAALVVVWAPLAVSRLNRFLVEVIS